ncbi:MAG TPA: hypothetical protein VD771_01965 [Gemmatimonadaceae bacterium]|nr:hypothetical protein [Gemmatimonadaceae bacterium]
MVTRAFSSYLFIQDPATSKAAQATPKATQDAARHANQSLRDQIREQVRAQIAGAAQEVPAAPAPPAGPRQITIRGPNGQETIVGVPSYNANEVIPPQAVDISLAFFFTVAAIIIGLPIARAFARRMDRKTAGSPQISGEVSAQLTQLTQAVDAIALEVERISEGQRFTTRLLSEQRDARQTLPAAADR